VTKERATREGGASKAPRRLARETQCAPTPVALLTYSVKPRGGVVHTLALAEALHAARYPVRVFALGDPAAGFHRTVHAPFTIVPAPPVLPTLEERVFASVDALTGALAEQVTAYPIMHAQDCISARAACAVRDAGLAGGPFVMSTAGQAGGPFVMSTAGQAGGPFVIRTVHHVDDFTSPSLIECQQRAIVEPDRVLVVSEHWRRLLRAQYEVEADVVHNGVDEARFRPADTGLAARLRDRAGAADRPLILSVGGIEPRKGSDTLVRALAILRESGREPVLAVVGGHSFQDYRAYADAVLRMLPELGLRLGRDVVQLGTVPDAELPAWYAAADVLAFPSTREGWGLAVLEAMSAGLPVVTSDLPVFLEYLRPGRDALVVPVGDAAALSRAIAQVLDDPALAARLRAAGLAVSRRFAWSRSAREHRAIYADVAAARVG
jgi:glycosyltransferase-like protein